MRRSGVAAASLLVPALGAAQGGFQPDAWVWAGALAAWAAALGIVLSSHAGGLAAAWRWPALAGLLLAWTLASTLWSAEPQQSLLEARRMVVYAAVVLAFVVLARRRAAWTLVAGTHLAVTGLLVYALGRYLLGSRTVDVFEGYLLSQPLGYANAVGILAVVGLLLALAPALEGRRPAVRAFGGATVPPLALALALSESNASWLALALGLLATAALAPRPVTLARTTVLLALPAGALVALARYSRYADVPSPRIGGAALAAAAVGAASAGALAATIGHRRSGPSRPTARRRGVVVAAATLVAAVGAAVAVAARGASEPRASYYRVAWHEYLAHPVLGSGAGTFGRYWLQSGPVGRFGGALDAHSLYLETLAELGPIGLVLLAGFLLYPLRRVVEARHLPGVPAATGAAVAFLVHAGLDWDWELPAVTVAGLACLAAVLLAGRHERTEPLPRLARTAGLACALALGLAAVAGTVSGAQPSAAVDDEAPPSGASSHVVR